MHAGVTRISSSSDSRCHVAPQTVGPSLAPCTAVLGANGSKPGLAHKQPEKICQKSCSRAPCRVDVMPQCMAATQYNIGSVLTHGYQLSWGRRNRTIQDAKLPIISMRTQLNHLTRSASVRRESSIIYEAKAVKEKVDRE